MLETGKELLVKARAIAGPLGQAAFYLGFPIIAVFGFVWVMALLPTMVVLLILKAIFGDEAIGDKTHDLIFYGVSIGGTLLVFYNGIYDLTNGFRNLNAPDLVIGYFTYYGMMLLIVGIYCGIMFLGIKLLTTFPILQYVLFALIAFAVASGFSNDRLRDCSVEWTTRGPICE